MTYEKLFDLKYVKNLSTYELVLKFPKQARRIHEVALLELPEETLRQILQEQDTFEHLMGLKRKLWKKTLI